jgi:hypothetical protein
MGRCHLVLGRLRVKCQEDQMVGMGEINHHILTNNKKEDEI